MLGQHQNVCRGLPIHSEENYRSHSYFLLRRSGCGACVTVALNSVILGKMTMFRSSSKSILTFWPLLDRPCKNRLPSFLLAVVCNLQNALHQRAHTAVSQLGPTVIVVCTSVIAVQPSRRLLSGQTFRATFSVASTSLSAENYDPQVAVTALNVTSVGTALSGTLAVRTL